ncbi:MAG: VapC toxin family PIN domain ribonuclease [Candidatus Methylomirabilota bacterium]|nr:PIN domain-containing protein [Candidatus Methylomirabilis sp.]PWB45936.1 MAG: VapC toxin family PIN domain ribonuclease [candidate division NC10 bacterium]
MPSILVDTGPLYAMADQDDDWHARVVGFIKHSDGELIVPVAVLPEAAYLLTTHLGPEAERKLVQSLINGEMALEQLTLQDLRRTLELLTRYAAARIGFVDASVVATAERLRISRILTTDRRDFSLIRPRHCKAFELLP